MKKNIHGNRYHAVAADGAVDPDHPLNVGKLSWWYPGLAGTPAAGSRLLDLCGKNHGTLTNMVASGPASGWQGLSRSGSYGAVAFDGTDDYIDTGSRVGPQTAFGMGCWIKPSNTTSTYVFGGQFDNVSISYFQFFLTTGGVLHGRIHQTLNSIYIGRTAPGITTGWNHVFMNWDGGTANANIQLYLNGLQVDNTDDSAGAFTAPNSQATTFFLGKQGPGQNFAGQMDGIVTYGVSSNAKRVASLFSLESVGYRVPDSPLRWASTRTWFVPAGGVTFNPGWAAGATSGVIGTGAY